MAESQHVDRNCSQALKVRSRYRFDCSSKPLQCSAPYTPQHVSRSCMRGARIKGYTYPFYGTLNHASLPQTLLLQAYMQGLDADPNCQDLVEKRTDAEHELSSEQIEAVMTALYGAGRYGIAQGGHVSADLARQPTFVVDISLTFPQVRVS